MWVYCSDELESKPVILCEYQKTRKKKHAQEFVKDFSGTCVANGYQVYNSFADEREELTIAGCWSHAGEDLLMW
ncbi:IS66 family transposase [Wansuia hejianensis]|uniref:IS66 family transposase n=1 Tax=Wansuia hejianensis TaxID=2763667 RepID=UPI0020164C34|nr:transposase [Wansuia hejianensis]